MQVPDKFYPLPGSRGFLVAAFAAKLHDSFVLEYLERSVRLAA
jgi:hypothetical protein